MKMQIFLIMNAIEMIKNLMMKKVILSILKNIIIMISHFIANNVIKDSFLLMPLKIILNQKGININISNILKYLQLIKNKFI